MNEPYLYPLPPSLAPLFYYAHLGSDGVVLSTSGAGVPFPPDAAAALNVVSLTADQFRTVSGPGRWDWNDGHPVLVPPAPPALNVAQARALASIDAAAEAARTLFLTPGSGQALEYQATQADAERAVADPEPLTAAAYPWLEAERLALAAVGTAATLSEVADLVLQQQAAWTQVGAAIKEIRRTAKMQVAAATTASEVEAVLAALSWPESN